MLRFGSDRLQGSLESGNALFGGMGRVLRLFSLEFFEGILEVRKPPFGHFLAGKLSISVLEADLF